MRPPDFAVTATAPDGSNMTQIMMRRPDETDERLFRRLAAWTRVVQRHSTHTLTFTGAYVAAGDPNAAHKLVSKRTTAPTSIPGGG